MALGHALDAIIKHRQSIPSLLSDDDRQRFEDLMRRFRDASELQRPVRAFELVAFLDDRLPRDHPVIRALAIDTQDMATAVNLDAIFEELRLAFEMDEAGETDIEADIALEVRRLLLAAPARSPAEVRSAGQDPDAEGLIRLRRDEKDIQLPSFQFDAQGRPLPVVVEINRILDADNDPWGVAGWWLDVNDWLGDLPAHLLGVVDDELLLDVARAEIEVD